MRVVGVQGLCPMTGGSPEPTTLVPMMGLWGGDEDKVAVQFAWRYCVALTESLLSIHPS